MTDPAPEVVALERRLARERRARLESERIAEAMTSQLYETVQRLEHSQVALSETASLVSVLQKVAIAANESATFEAAVAIALGSVCEHTGWPVGHLYVTDEPGHLTPTAVWHVDDPARTQSFRTATERTALGAGVGLPGRVLASGAPAWIQDVMEDANFPRSNAAVDIDVRAGFAFPILVGAEVVGVLEFFAREPMEPNQPLLLVMANVGSQLGRVVERTRGEESVRLSEQRTREVIETANDAFIAVDCSGRIADWNHQAELHFGWTREEAIGRLLTETIIPPIHREAHLQGIRRFLASGSGALIGRRVELEAMHRDGHQFPIELTPWAVAEGASFRFNAFIHDITERKAFQQQLEHHSLHDELTGLPNRALLLDRVEHGLARASRSGGTVAVFFVDLDRFKAVNDSFGHQAGDAVLVEVAERIPTVLRPGDTLARLSGDEFVILCEDVPDQQTALDLAERVLTVLAAPFPLEEGEAHISGSIGIALSGAGPLTPEELLGDADMAMYRAKERGKGVSELFDEELRVKVTKRLATERSLRHAIDHDELVAHFQPVVDLRAGEIIGAEALVRWRHPERGLLLPGEFISLAEDSALIGRLGQWMVRESCAHLAALREAHPDRPLWMAVNLSVSELEQRQLVTWIGEAISAHGLPPEALVFEITESAVMHDAQAVIRHLWELREMGVQLAIDDFGTGFSSLDRLRRMPVQALKIDRSFIVDMETTAGGTALVAAVIAMSHSLGLEVVAEGVELPEQLDCLRRLGCDHAQGYLLGRPEPVEALFEALASEATRELLRAGSEAAGASNVYDEMSRIISHALTQGDEVQRTTRSLLAEIKRLLGGELLAT